PAGIERAQALLILHQQDRAAAGEIRRRLRRLAREYELARFGGSRLLGTRDMTRQENAEDGAASDLRFREDEAAGLLDDAVDGGKAEPRALADLLGREEWLEDFVDMFRRDALAGVADLDQHVVARGDRFVGEACAFRLLEISRPDLELAAIRHCISGVDRKIYDHLLELGEVGADR